MAATAMNRHALHLWQQRLVECSMMNVGILAFDAIELLALDGPRLRLSGGPTAVRGCS